MKLAMWAFIGLLLLQIGTITPASAQSNEPDFPAASREISLSVGGAFGTRAFGGKETHDLELLQIRYGQPLSDLKPKESCLNGYWELLGEATLGWQVEPESAYFFALAPLLRYNFMTGTRIAPFMNVGAGVAYTDIGRPDLSTKFEFISQGGCGTHLFLNQAWSLTLDYRFAHVSNAGIRRPNRGMNNHIFSAGLSYWF